MFGGLLVQDVNNHGIWGTHEMINKDGESYEITSLHHQMAYPWTINPDHFDVLFDTPHRSIHEVCLYDEATDAYNSGKYDYVVTDYNINKTLQELIDNKEVRYNKYFDELYYLNYHYEGDKIDLDVIKQHNDPEVIYFHVPGMPRVLGVQGHPEMMDSKHPTVEMLNNLIDDLLCQQ